MACHVHIGPIFLFSFSLPSKFPHKYLHANEMSLVPLSFIFYILFLTFPSCIIQNVFLFYEWNIHFVQKKVLLALEDAGIFTSGGLAKDKVRIYSYNIKLISPP